MKVANYIINYLADLGIDKIFVVYGSANGDLVDAFVHNDKIDYVCTMHEQGGGFAAEGYAKTSRNFGVAISTSGPGAMNLVTSIGNCFYDSVPCLFLTGQIDTNFLRPSKEIRQIGFQEAATIDIVTPICKYATMITNKEDIKYELEKALHLMKSGRPGPVVLDLPLNIQKQEIDPNKLIGYNIYTKCYDQQQVSKQVNKYIQDLKNSQRPVLLIGNGVKLSKAEYALNQLQHLLRIPTYPTWNAIDVVASDNPYYGGRIGTYGGPGRNFGIQNSDLILSIGSRISGRITGGNIHSFARQAKKYIVDVDEAGLQPQLQQVPFDECILCDAHEFISKLHTQLIIKADQDDSFTLRDQFAGWMKQCRLWKNKYDPVTNESYKSDKTVNPYAFIRILSEEMKKNDIILGDCGGNIVIMSHAFQTKTGQTYITNNGNSPMGFSMSAAMGAWFANKNNSKNKNNVVCVSGDGGICMNIQELQTIKNYNIGIKIIILNNHIYGITKAFQETNFEGRCEACGPIGYNPPDFIKVSKAFGLKTMSIDNKNDISLIRQQIQELLNTDGPIICDVNIHEHHQYLPRIKGWDCPIEDMEPYLDTDEFTKNMYIEWEAFSKYKRGIIGSMKTL